MTPLELAELKDRLDLLELSLEAALDGWQEASQYKGKYLQEKHGDLEEIQALRDVLANKLPA